MKNTHLAAVNVGGIEKIKRQCRHEVDQEPTFHVVHGDAPAIADYFALSAHVRCPEVQNDIWGRIMKYSFATCVWEDRDFFREKEAEEWGGGKEGRKVSKVLRCKYNANSWKFNITPTRDRNANEEELQTRSRDLHSLRLSRLWILIAGDYVARH